jgi:hypothetical protein
MRAPLRPFQGWAAQRVPSWAIITLPAGLMAISDRSITEPSRRHREITELRHGGLYFVTMLCKRGNSSLAFGRQLERVDCVSQREQVISDGDLPKEVRTSLGIPMMQIVLDRRIRSSFDE